ncbi:MAG TPA: WXG100 family type VII secretion target [Galbitalea sp.]|jgi:WXG100 family type VII secretion target|nr:WXG100 family type VII secretion target [Galbitalea sp.]
MADINVTYADLKDVSAKLVAGQNDLVSKLNELKTLVNNLVAGGYVTDQSSRAFDETFNQFVTGATQAVDGLDGLSKFLSSAADALQGTDTQLANSIKSN